MIHGDLERFWTEETGYSSKCRKFSGEPVSMRLWHLVVVILALSLIFTIVRDPVGRVALIVFVTALGEAVFGTTAVLALFQTIGALGEAKGLFAHAEAVATTALVLIIATTIMSSWLFAGAWLVQAAIP
jgi:membrane associated rhomboid family serine protease